MPKDEKLHILFLSSWYPNQEAPLDGNFVLKHAEAVAHFARVSFLHVSSLPLTNKVELDLQATIHFYESQVLPRKGLRKIFLVLQKLWRYSQLYRQVCRELGKPDVIHANVAYPSGLYALFFKLFTRSPYLITEHWTGYLPEKNTPLRPFQKTMTKWVLRKASFICPVSGYLARSMRNQDLNGCYQVVPNVVDTDLYLPKHKEDYPGKLHLIHISTLNNRQKNSEGLFRAIATLQNEGVDFELLVVTCNSDGYWQKKLKGTPLEDVVSFRYALKPKEVALALHQSDVLLLFSNYETFGVVIAEAFAAGIPVISTASGPAKELIAPERGILIPIGDEKALVKAIKDFPSQKTRFQADKIQTYAREHFSFRAVGQQYMDLYSQMLKPIPCSKK